MKAATKTQFACTACGAQQNKWAGQCPDCNAWNSITEVVLTAPAARQHGYTGEVQSVARLDAIQSENETRILSDIKELDHVLGGGLVKGSVVLIGGDPGIGKSTLLLDMLCALGKKSACLYVTGEESPAQVSSRATRLNLPKENIWILAQTHCEQITEVLKEKKPQVVVIDSIQTMFTDNVSAAPGSVSQVRESAAIFVQYAKQTGTTLFFVGHVTKEGMLAGPRVLEHMVDTVLYFEGQKENRYRVLRAVKNRFGAVNELGIFAMSDKGLREVSNPSAIFLNRSHSPVPGSVVMVSWEGSRPFLVEVQALVDKSYAPNPRRVTVGLDSNRLALTLAVLHRHGGVPTYDTDVFVNVVGGVKISETGVDLALLFACVSSLKHKPLPADWIVFGEVGLAGEIRPVQGGQERLKEAHKHGFKRAIIPKGNMSKTTRYKGLEIIGVSRLSEALAELH